MAVLLGTFAGKRILEALGIDANKCRKLDIHFVPNGPVIIEVEMYADEENINYLVTEFKKYNLVLKEEEEKCQEIKR